VASLLLAGFAAHGLAELVLPGCGRRGLARLAEPAPLAARLGSWAACDYGVLAAGVFLVCALSLRFAPCPRTLCRRLRAAVPQPGPR
jgi:hypothetical protein